MRYTVVLVPGKVAAYVAYVPAIPGCVTQGDSLEDAIAMAQDAAEALLADMAEDGEELPIEVPGAVVATIEVAVPTPVAAD